MASFWAVNFSTLALYLNHRAVASSVSRQRPHPAPVFAATEGIKPAAMFRNGGASKAEKGLLEKVPEYKKEFELTLGRDHDVFRG